MDGQLEDRILALELLLKDVRKKKFSPLFRNLPEKRGQLNIREFVQNMKEFDGDQEAPFQNTTHKDKSLLEVQPLALKPGSPKPIIETPHIPTKKLSRRSLNKQFTNQKENIERKGIIKDLEVKIKSKSEILPGEISFFSS